jgi:hypothetical protein
MPAFDTAAHNILCGSEEGTARSVPPAAGNDASFFTGQWTVYSGLCTDSEDESAAQGAGRTRRSVSTPPADRSRLPAERSRHDDLTRRIGRSPSSERRRTEEASSILPEAFSAGCLRPASAEPRTFEAASSYVTEEFEGGLTFLKRAERSAAEEASPHYSAPVTSRLAPADVKSGISDGAEISSTVVADGPATVAEETGVSQSNWRQVEEASPASSEVPTEDTACSDTEDSGVSDGSGTSSAVVGASTASTGAGASLPTTHLRRNLDEDTMSYAYPKYANHPDAAAHVKQFRSIWAVNHGTQGLTPTEREQSMIVEF